MIDNILVDNSSVVFILESPATTEVNNGYPLAGRAGMEIASRILGIKDMSMGEICKQGMFNEYGLSPFSILNISTFPMESKSYGSSPLPDNISMLEDLKGLIDHQSPRDGEDHALQWTVPQNAALKELKNDLLNELSQSLIRVIKINKDIQIIPCGKIAQVFVKRALETQNSIPEKNVHHEIPHPARTPWSALSTSKRNELKTLLTV